MPYKTKLSPFYEIRRRNLVGYGDSSRISSRTKSKELAQAMENALVALAEKCLIEPQYYPLMDAICKEKTITPGELLRAKRSRKLDLLLRSFSDPLLSDAVEAFAPHISDHQQFAAQMLIDLAKSGARLSDLNAKEIMRICRAYESTGISKNSVRRWLLQLISKLLKFHLGKIERDKIFQDVHYKGTDDTRLVHLSTDDISLLLDAAQSYNPELKTFILTSILTTGDRGVLLSGEADHGRVCRGLLCKDVVIYQNNENGHYFGQVDFSHDSKAKSRKRIVPIGDMLCRELMPLLHRKKPAEPVFSISYRGVDYMWKKVRKQVGLEQLRIKDLRAVASQYGEQAGITPTAIEALYGHRSGKMRERYQRHNAAVNHDHVSMIESRIFGNEKAGDEGKIKKIRFSALNPAQSKQTGTD